MNAVFFDLDGVIVDSEPYHVKAWRSVLQHCAIFLSDAYLNEGIGRTDLDFALRVINDFHLDQAPKELINRKDQAMRSFIEAGMPSPLGIADFVRKTAVKYKTGIVSSSNRWFIDAVVEKISLDSCFPVRITVEDIEHEKPHPEPYLLAAEKSQIEPGECWAVEDSPAGAASAKTAGMNVLGVCSSFNKNVLAETCDYTVEDFTDPVLKDLFKL